MADQMNYVIGRGRLFFGQYKTGTRVPRGQLYFGNTPALSLSQSEDVLDHYSSEEGTRVIDESATLQNDSDGSFSCDNISNDNLALWFRGITEQRIETGSASATGTLTMANAVPVAGDKFTIDGHDLAFVAANPVGLQVLIGATLNETADNLAAVITANQNILGVTAPNPAAAVVTVTALHAGTGGNAITLAKTFTTGANGTVSGATLAGGTDVTETLSDVELGRWYQLGVTADTPFGVANIGVVTITGIDEDSYTYEQNTGRLLLHADAPDIVEGGDIEVKYGVDAGTEDLVIAKTETIVGELAFISNNAAGEQRDYLWPYVRLSPDGDFSLKGDDWQTTTFTFKILKKDSVTERQYIRKRV